MIHESAYVDPRAELGRDVTIGPNAYVGSGVVLRDGCVVHNNATITGNTICGRSNEFFPHSIVGAAPQDLKYRGEPTRVVIGDENVFRELVTVHAGTEVGGGVTTIGSRNRFLVSVHIAHDATIGNECILSNNVQLAGHVRLEDRVTMGGLIGVHHFATIGMLAFIGGLTRVVNDVPPFMILEGNPARIRGFNERGMRRWGYTDAQVQAVREAYRVLYGARGEGSGVTMLERMAGLEQRAELNGEVQYLCESIRRSMIQGVHGRYLESFRRDADADREAFYGTNQENEA